jgi:hypothetical protein
VTGDLSAAVGADAANHLDPGESVETTLPLETGPAAGPGE